MSNDTNDNKNEDVLKEDLTALVETIPKSFSYDFTQEDVEYLWGVWADFSIKLVAPAANRQLPPKFIWPEKNEFAHPILDYGNELCTSRGEDLFLGRRTFGKLMATVEKMVTLTIKRTIAVLDDEDETGTGEHDQEIQISFGGFETLKRKAFRNCIESEHNILVTNFDPGEWGERQLRCFNELVEKGYLRIRM